MVISLGDALGISEVRLPRQSAVAFKFRVPRLCQNVSGLPVSNSDRLLGGHPSKSLNKRPWRPYSSFAF